MKKTLDLMEKHQAWHHGSWQPVIQKKQIFSFVKEVFVERWKVLIGRSVDAAAAIYRPDRVFSLEHKRVAEGGVLVPLGFKIWCFTSFNSGVTILPLSLEN